MKQKRNFIAVLFLLLLCTVINICPAAWADSLEVYVDPPCEHWKGTFFGIWIGASKTLEDAKREAYNAPEEIGVVQIFLTTDWSNLNTEPWYVLTAGMYTNVVEAEGMLPEIQAYYPDAYIKYSGNRISSFSGNAEYNTEETIATRQPFYGIWCQAAKSSSEAEKYAQKMKNNGFSSASVFLTTDWNNLNKEKWYVVTAGVYRTEAEAKNSLSRVQTYYSDAYVKYSGNYQGDTHGSTSNKKDSQSSEETLKSKTVTSQLTRNGSGNDIDGTYIFEGVKLYEDNHLNTPVPNTPWEGNTVQIKRKSDKTIYLTVGEGCYNAGKTIAYEKDFTGRYLSSIDLEWLTFENGDLVLYGEEGDFVDRYAQVYKKVSENVASNVTDNSPVYEGQIGIFEKQNGRYFFTGDISAYDESRVGKNGHWTEGFYTVTSGTFYVDENTKVTANYEDFPVKGKIAVAWLDDFYERKKYWMVLTVKVKGNHVEEITGIVSVD